MIESTTDDALYVAFESRDARFDGRFFVGVTSTGIYCRPSCHAKMPRRENCVFFSSAAQAEQAGFRPCMSCRPELAPGRSVVDARSSLARRAATLLEETCNNRLGMESLAGKLGCTTRHLRRVFEEEHDVSPMQYVQTCRLLLAKSLLTDTQLPISQVSAASGFGSVRAFNKAFADHYHLPPTRLRKRAGKGGPPQGEDLALYLGYQPPYAWDALLRELRERAKGDGRAIDGGTYRRTVQLQAVDGTRHDGWIEVSDVPAKSRLRLRLSPSLLPVLPQVMARTRRAFDTACDPEAIAAVLSPHALPNHPYTPGTRLIGRFDDDEEAPWPDAPCENDETVIAAMPGATAEERLKHTRAWSPWRSYYRANLLQEALANPRKES